MGLFEAIKSVFGFFGRKKGLVEPETIYPTESVVEEIHSLWDYIKFNTQSQAHHICSVLGFEEWVAMDEILRRIKDLFGVLYQNERSLYPYIKTLVDCSLLETSSFAGKKHWRKRELLIKIEEKKQTTEKKQIVAMAKQK